MYLKVTLLALLFSGFSGLATFVLSFNLVIVIFGKRIFAAFLDFFSTKYNEVSDSMKVELFKELNDTQPGEKVSKHPLSFLDKRKKGEVTFLAVQNSSIGDLVTNSLPDSTFTFDIQRATLETCDL